MSEPINRAMLLGDDAIPTPDELHVHAAESVLLFLAAPTRTEPDGSPSH